MPITKVWRGKTPIICGGTRNKIVLDRPWQSDLDDLLLKTCPFCTKDQTKYVRLDNLSEGGESWRVLENPATPWTEVGADHFLLIPKKCWPKEELRRLGGKEKIAAVLQIMGALMRGNLHQKFEMCIHVGRNAGQNQGHAHFHLFPLPLDARSSMEETFENAWMQKLYASEITAIKSKPQLRQTDSDFFVFCDGTRAGQCFIVSTLYDESLFLDSHIAPRAISYAEKLDALLGLYENKFRSTQGLSPDFIVSAVFYKGIVEYLTIIPILTQWGGPEYTASLEGSPYSLPWQHEVTAEYLNAE